MVNILCSHISPPITIAKYSSGILRVNRRKHIDSEGNGLRTLYVNYTVSMYLHIGHTPGPDWISPMMGSTGQLAVCDPPIHPSHLLNSTHNSLVVDDILCGPSVKGSPK